MPENNSSLVAPPHMTFLKFILKFFAGLFAGAIGTLLVLAVFLATSSILEPLTAAQNANAVISPVFIFILVLMVFLGSIGANLLGATFMYFVDRDKYNRIYSTLLQIVISNVILLFLIIPVYFVAAGISTDIIMFVAALHFILAAQVSNLTLELIASPQYGLLGVYSTAIAIIMSMVIVFAVLQFSDNGTILLFIALPVIWGTIGFAGGVVDGVYGWVARTWGVDFAASNTNYGNDY